MKTATGNYRIDYFNADGEVMPSCSLVTLGLSEAAASALAIAHWQTLEHAAAGYMLMLCTYTSSDY
jgi:hypothetical protein